MVLGELSRSCPRYLVQVQNVVFSLSQFLFELDFRHVTYLLVWLSALGHIPNSVFVFSSQSYNLFCQKSQVRLSVEIYLLDLFIRIVLAQVKTICKFEILICPDRVHLVFYRNIYFICSVVDTVKYWVYSWFKCSCFISFSRCSNLPSSEKSLVNNF